MAGKELLFIVATLILAPALLLYLTLDYFAVQKNSGLLEATRIKAIEPLHQITHYRNIENFWCATLNEELKNSKSPQDMAKRIENLAEITGESLDYAIWNDRQHVELSNFLEPASFHYWDGLLEDARNGLTLISAPERQAREAKVRKILGPHYLSELFNRPQSPAEPHLIRPDSAGRFPFVWLNDGYRLQTHGAVVLFKPDIISRDHRLSILKSIWQKTNAGLQHIRIDKSGEITGTNSVALKAAIFEFIENGREVAQFGKNLIAIARISETEFVANIVEIAGYGNNSGRNTMMVVLLTLFALTLILRSRPGLLQPENISIRRQLLVLLFICSGLPLLALSLGGLEHLKQQREHLIRSAYQSCIEFIQAIDLRSSGELSHVMTKSYNAVNEFKELYRKREPERELILKTLSRVHPSTIEFRAVASSSNYIIAHNGVYRDGFFYHRDSLDYRRDKTPVQISMANQLGSYYLDFFNGVAINPEQYTDTEMLTEMFFQKTIVEMVHDLILATDNIEFMGWGSNDFPVFMNLIAIIRPDIADFFFMAAYESTSINREFIMRQTDNLLRNEAGLKVFFYDKYQIYPIDRENRHHPELRQIFDRIGTHLPSEPQHCSYAGENWVYSGYKGNLLHNFSLLAMYPLSTIDTAIEKERQFIVYSALATLVILLSLTLLFAHSFTVPLAQLKSAAEAVEKRDFAFKLPDLGHDEFGEMGRIFNRSIAELEELSLASIVQSRLMPAHTIDSGRFAVFGRSVPMADLGGDYYDYFSIDDNRFAVLLGDVAGHGVGASLIMAMAKTAIICCQEFHDQPLQILNKLHQLICTTRSKTQRKIMTFQYFCFDKTSGTGKYANAGGCSPMLVCPESASASEISLAGPVLGGFKKSQFSESELQIQPGQALVLYTDGIIESKNPAGDEIGYERFKQWLINHYSNDAATYYHALYDEYLRWLAGGDAQDDLTLIILVYSP